MRTCRLTKALLLAIPSGLWLARGDASIGRTIALVLGGALVTWAAIRLVAARFATPAPASQAAVLGCCTEPRVIRRCTRRARPPAPGSCAERPIRRIPSGRRSRDLRCSASRATARARGSTRR